MRKSRRFRARPWGPQADKGPVRIWPGVRGEMSGWPRVPIPSGSARITRSDRIARQLWRDHGVGDKTKYANIFPAIGGKGAGAYPASLTRASFLRKWRSRL